MDSTNSALYHYLMKQADQIADEWMAQIPSEKDNIAAEFQYFVHAVSNVLTEEKTEKYWEKAGICLKQMARDRAARQMPVMESVKGFKIFRCILMDKIQAFSNDHDCSKKHLFAWNKRLHSLMDEIIEHFLSEYDQATASCLKAQKEMIHELSAPVIPISAQIGILPLIGEIDTHRAKVIIESALSQCTALHLSHLFIDISGVPVVDTMVAYQLFKVVDSTKLLGIETIISGIRPEIAQTVVKLGIDFSHIKTEQSLAKALGKKGFCIREEHGLQENKAGSDLM